jgi:hypothetical protein
VDLWHEVREGGQKWLYPLGNLSDNHVSWTLDPRHHNCVTGSIMLTYL